MNILVVAPSAADQAAICACLRRCYTDVVLQTATEFAAHEQRSDAPHDAIVIDSRCVPADGVTYGYGALPVHRPPAVVVIDATGLTNLHPQGSAPISVSAASLLPGLLQDAVELGRLAGITRGRAGNDLYDALTGLPDRRLFVDRLDRAIREAARSDRPLALLVLDLGLDNHPAARDERTREHLLLGVAARFGRLVRDADTIGRIGPDQFAAVLSIGDTPDGDVIVAEKICERIAQPFVLGDPATTAAISVAATAGLALFPEHGDRASVLLPHADTALLQGRQSGQPIAIYAPAEPNQAPAPLMSHTLRGALASEQLFTMVQPQVRLDTAEVIGMEALVRWRHPQLGLLGPTKFLPMAERSEHLETMTLQVLSQALSLLQRLQSRASQLTVSVNLSTRLLHREDLVEHIQQLVHNSGVDPRLLCLEVTETAIMASPGLAERTLGALSELGIGLSVDDFGTGYSSLKYLRNFPIDEIKIDKLFVAGIGEGKRDGLIVDSIVALGKAFDVRVLAEGIENAATRRELVQRGCLYGQGYLFGQPMIPTEFEHWLVRWQAALGDGWRPWGQAAEAAGGSGTAATD